MKLRSRSIQGPFSVHSNHSMGLLKLERKTDLTSLSRSLSSIKIYLKLYLKLSISLYKALPLKSPLYKALVPIKDLLER